MAAFSGEVAAGGDGVGVEGAGVFPGDAAADVGDFDVAGFVAVVVLFGLVEVAEGGVAEAGEGGSSTTDPVKITMLVSASAAAA